jgi:molecular chaperone GrpE
MRIPIQYDAAPRLDSSGSERGGTCLQLVEPEPASPHPEQEQDDRARPRVEDPEIRALDRALAAKHELSADFDNYRRHAEAKLKKAREEATHEVLAELGDVVRSLELAAASADDDPDAVREGIALVARGFKAVFDRHGLERIPTEGQPFDPRVHEAVLVEQTSGVERGTVVRELSPGFRAGDRVVRPARVAVAG